MKTLLSLIFSFVLVIAYSQDANTLVDEGIRFHDAGEYTMALEKYMEAIKLDPKNGAAYYEAMYTYYSKKDYEEALKMGEKSLQFGSDNAKKLTYVSMGSIHDDMGNPKKALKVYETGLKKYPDYYLLWFNYAITLTATEKLKEAEEAYIKALSNNFNHPGSHYQLGNLMYRQDSKAKAALCYYRFLMLENNTKRSKDVAQNLWKMMYGNQTKGKEITININSAALDNGSAMGAAELFFNFLGIDAGTDSTKAKLTPQQRFVKDTDSYFELLIELKAKEPSSKKQKADDFYLDKYAVYFKDLKDAGFTEAMCNHIMKSKNDSEVENWLIFNKVLLDRYFLWVKSH